MAEVSLAAAAPLTFFRERVQQHLQDVADAICAEHDSIIEELQKTATGGPVSERQSFHSEDSRDRYELRRKRLVRLKVAAQEGYVGPSVGNVSLTASALANRLSNGHGKLATANEEPWQQMGMKASFDGVLPCADHGGPLHHVSHPHHVGQDADPGSASSSRAPSRSSSPARGNRMPKAGSHDFASLSFRSNNPQRMERSAVRASTSPMTSESHSSSGSFFGTCGVAMPPGFSPGAPSSVTPSAPPSTPPPGFSLANCIRGRRQSQQVDRISNSSRNNDWMSDSASAGMGMSISRSRGGADDPMAVGRLRSGINSFGNLKSPAPHHVGQQGSSNIMSAHLSRGATDNFVFEVLPQWQQVHTLVKNAAATKMKRISANGPLPELAEAGHDGRWSNFATRYILSEGISPASKKRMVWDIFTALFVLWDLVMIPTQFLDLPRSAFDAVMSWVVAFFWTSDIFVTLATGIVLSDGTVVLALPQIAAAYARTWMVPDVGLSLSAWGDIFVGASHGVRFLPFFRIMRMLRLARLARLQVVLNSLMDTNSVMLNLIISIVKSICAIILLVHVIACVWVGIGRVDEEAWVFRKGLLEAGSSHQYSIAFLWSLTQFTGAFADPWGDQTKGERVFSTFALLFGFLMASCFVSNITSLMTQISMVANHQSHQLKVLTRYLQAHNVSKRLSERLQRNVQHALRVQAGGTPEHEIKVLKLVSEPLMKELHFELYASVLKVHPLFRWLGDEDPASLRAICHTAIAEIVVFEADVIFCPGEVSSNPCMLFVLSGVLQYIQTDDDMDVLDLDGAMPGREVAPGEWLCEHFLWTKWIYQGMLLAKTESRFLAVTARRFQEILSNTKSKLSVYAGQFVAAINLEIETMSDLGSSVDSESIVGKLGGGGPRRPSFLTGMRPGATAATVPALDNPASVVPL